MALIYQPKVYRAQGSTRLVVASGGEIEVESGGLLDLQSGSTIDLNGVSVIGSGGTFKMESGALITGESGSTINLQSGAVLDYETGSAGQIGGTAAIPDTGGYIYAVSGLRLAVETATSTANLSLHGLSLVNPTSSARYTLPVPTAVGIVKVIKKIQATTTVLATVGSATGATFDGTNAYMNMSVAESVMLMARTTALWQLLPSSQAVTAGWTSGVTFSTT